MLKRIRKKIYNYFFKRNRVKQSVTHSKDHTNLFYPLL